MDEILSETARKRASDMSALGQIVYWGVNDGPVLIVCFDVPVCFKNFVKVDRPSSVGNRNDVRRINDVFRALNVDD